MSRGRPTDLHCLGLIVLAWAAVVAGVGLGGDFPLNDDWVYAWSARRLVETGRLEILDWAAPSLIGHVWWGAALIRAFGDSYVVLRAGTLVWGLSGIVLSYVLARRIGEPPQRALLPALALGLSPWYVNLSFTFMTDVPWLAMMLAPVCVLAFALRDGARPRPLLLLCAGALIGWAALTRQFAVLALPPMMLALAWDARARKRRGFFIEASLSSLLLCAPAVAMVVPFHWWYAHVHLPTIANRDTWTRMREVSWEPFVDTLAILHYFGMWLIPIAAGVIAARHTRELVTRKKAIVFGALLSGFAVVNAVWRAVESMRPWKPPYMHPYFMPYLGNIFYQTGLGPPTVFDTYSGRMPAPRESLVFGVLLTIGTTIAGVIGCSLVCTAVNKGWRDLRNRPLGEPPRPSPSPDGAMKGEEPHLRRAIRLMVIGVGGVYLLWVVCTGTFVYDRYLLPALPLVVLLALDAMPRLRFAPVALLLALTGALSVAGTREYLSWNGARDRLVRRLEAGGLTAEQIDGGFEINGPRRFRKWFARTGELICPDGNWWCDGATVHVSFWPGGKDRCTTVDEEAYWSLTGRRAMYALRCPQPDEPTEPRVSRW